MSSYKSAGGVYAHRRIAEAALGKPLPEGAVVHHVDEDKKNNANSNLVICPSAAYHALLHVRMKVMDNGGDPDKDKWCSYHKKVEPMDGFSFIKSRGCYHNMCRQATNEYRKGKGYKSEWTDLRRVQQQERRDAAK